VIAGVAVAIVWSRIFSPHRHSQPLSESNFASKRPGWFTDPDWAVPGLVIMSLWGVGAAHHHLPGGLAGHPSRSSRRAVDGANVLQRFRHVTLP
jgi:multiple sugar transport system permease protein